MKSVAILLADGFEEIEALATADILRRAGIAVSLVGVSENFVRGTHDIIVKSDITLDELDGKSFDMIVLPGGLPGASNLALNKNVIEIVRDFDLSGKFIAAICAAPMVLGEAGVLKDSFTCYPGFESNVKTGNAKYTSEKNVVKDKNIITAKGPAISLEFALFIVSELTSKQTSDSLKSDLLLELVNA
ncbi:DJ-1 family glyoxalase III [Campylobacter mucosalis]|uniref:DJ-1 family glyoxalase III n=1 Tax=Campylobacter mucosalis TaxID=202 RepID=UPI00146FF7BC|nr:DJ-1 family glyoxalase III [Campylobacter mucosalis]